MPGVFVLGPSVWVDPGNVQSTLANKPLETRQELAELGQRFGVDAFMMEGQPVRDGEIHSDLFRRLVVEKDVQSFLILLPLGCRLLGLEKELGALLEWISQGWLEPDRLFVLAEAALWDDSDDGAMGALNEPGNRTRYHEDLVSIDARIRLWDDRESLDAHAINVFAETKTNHPEPWYEQLIGKPGRPRVGAAAD